MRYEGLGENLADYCRLKLHLSRRLSSVAARKDIAREI
jgi:hypothetical protein